MAQEEWTREDLIEKLRSIRENAQTLTVESQRFPQEPFAAYNIVPSILEISQLLPMILEMMDANIMYVLEQIENAEPQEQIPPDSVRLSPPLIFNLLNWMESNGREQFAKAILETLQPQPLYLHEQTVSQIEASLTHATDAPSTILKLILQAEKEGKSPQEISQIVESFVQEQNWPEQAQIGPEPQEAPLQGEVVQEPQATPLPTQEQQEAPLQGEVAPEQQEAPLSPPELQEAPLQESQPETINEGEASPEESNPSSPEVPGEEDA